MNEIVDKDRGTIDEFLRYEIEVKKIANVLWGKHQEYKGWCFAISMPS